MSSFRFLRSQRKGTNVTQAKKSTAQNRVSQSASVLPWGSTDTNQPSEGVLCSATSTNSAPRARKSEAWASKNSRSWIPSWPRLSAKRANAEEFSKQEMNDMSVRELQSPLQQRQPKEKLVANSEHVQSAKHKLGATSQQRLNEGSAPTSMLLECMYGVELQPEQIQLARDLFPEIDWLAHCSIRAPASPGWYRDLTRQIFVCEATGEISHTTPDFGYFVLLARVLVASRQTPAQAPSFCSWLEQTKDSMYLEASRCQDVWAGPFRDPTSGEEYYYCPETRLSTWDVPKSRYLFLACVTERLSEHIRSGHAQDEEATKPSAPAPHLGSSELTVSNQLFARPVPRNLQFSAPHAELCQKGLNLFSSDPFHRTLQHKSRTQASIKLGHDDHTKDIRETTGNESAETAAAVGCHSKPMIELDGVEIRRLSSELQFEEFRAAIERELFDADTTALNSIDPKCQEAETCDGRAGDHDVEEINARIRASSDDLHSGIDTSQEDHRRSCKSPASLFSYDLTQETKAAEKAKAKANENPLLEACLAEEERLRTEADRKIREEANSRKHAQLQQDIEQVLSPRSQAFMKRIMEEGKDCKYFKKQTKKWLNAVYSFDEGAKHFLLLTGDRLDVRVECLVENLISFKTETADFPEDVLNTLNPGDSDRVVIVVYEQSGKHKRCCLFMESVMERFDFLRCMQEIVSRRAATKFQARLQVVDVLREPILGVRVMRGPNWQWGDQDGGEGNLGTTVDGAGAGWINVLWDHGKTQSHRIGSDDNYDLKYYSSDEAGLARNVVHKDCEDSSTYPSTYLSCDPGDAKSLPSASSCVMSGLTCAKDFKHVEDFSLFKSDVQLSSKTKSKDRNSSHCDEKEKARKDRKPSCCDHYFEEATKVGDDSFASHEHRKDRDPEQTSILDDAMDWQQRDHQKHRKHKRVRWVDQQDSNAHKADNSCDVLQTHDRASCVEGLPLECGGEQLEELHDVSRLSAEVLNSKCQAAQASHDRASGVGMEQVSAEDHERSVSQHAEIKTNRRSKSRSNKSLVTACATEDASTRLELPKTCDHDMLLPCDLEGEISSHPSVPCVSVLPCFKDTKHFVDDALCTADMTVSSKTKSKDPKSSRSDEKQKKHKDRKSVLSEHDCGQMTKVDADFEFSQKHRKNRGLERSSIRDMAIEQRERDHRKHRKQKCSRWEDQQDSSGHKADSSRDVPQAHGLASCIEGMLLEYADEQGQEHHDDLRLSAEALSLIAEVLDADERQVPESVQLGRGTDDVTEVESCLLNALRESADSLANPDAIIPPEQLAEGDSDRPRGGLNDLALEVEDEAPKPPSLLEINASRTKPTMGQAIRNEATTRTRKRRTSSHTESSHILSESPSIPRIDIQMVQRGGFLSPPVVDRLITPKSATLEDKATDLPQPKSNGGTQNNISHIPAKWSLPVTSQVPHCIEINNESPRSKYSPPVVGYTVSCPNIDHKDSESRSAQSGHELDRNDFQVKTSHFSSTRIGMSTNTINASVPAIKLAGITLDQNVGVLSDGATTSAPFAAFDDRPMQKQTSRAKLLSQQEFNKQGMKDSSEKVVIALTPECSETDLKLLQPGSGSCTQIAPSLAPLPSVGAVASRNSVKTSMLADPDEQVAHTKPKKIYILHTEELQLLVARGKTSPPTTNVPCDTAPSLQTAKEKDSRAPLGRRSLKTASTEDIAVDNVLSHGAHISSILNNGTSCGNVEYKTTESGTTQSGPELEGNDSHAKIPHLPFPEFRKSVGMFSDSVNTCVPVTKLAGIPIQRQASRAELLSQQPDKDGIKNALEKVVETLSPEWSNTGPKLLQPDVGSFQQSASSLAPLPSVGAVSSTRTVKVSTLADPDEVDDVQPKGIYGLDSEHLKLLARAAHAKVSALKGLSASAPTVQAAKGRDEIAPLSSKLRKALDVDQIDNASARSTQAASILGDAATCSNADQTVVAELGIPQNATLSDAVNTRVLAALPLQKSASALPYRANTNTSGMKLAGIPIQRQRSSVKLLSQQTGIDQEPDSAVIKDAGIPIQRQRSSVKLLSQQTGIDQEPDKAVIKDALEKVFKVAASELSDEDLKLSHPGIGSFKQSPSSLAPLPSVGAVSSVSLKASTQTDLDQQVDGAPPRKMNIRRLDSVQLQLLARAARAKAATLTDDGHSGSATSLNIMEDSGNSAPLTPKLRKTTSADQSSTKCRKDPAICAALEQSARALSRVPSVPWSRALTKDHSRCHVAHSSVSESVSPKTETMNGSSDMKGSLSPVVGLTSSLTGLPSSLTCM